MILSIEKPRSHMNRYYRAGRYAFLYAKERARKLFNGEDGNFQKAFRLIQARQSIAAQSCRPYIEKGFCGIREKIDQLITKKSMKEINKRFGSR